MPFSLANTPMPPLDRPDSFVRILKASRVFHPVVCEPGDFKKLVSEPFLIGELTANEVRYVLRQAIFISESDSTTLCAALHLPESEHAWLMDFLKHHNLLPRHN